MTSALGEIVHVVTYMSVLDWVLVVVAVTLLGWAWIWGAAFARLGAITVNDFTADDSTLARGEIKAELQRQLGERGLLPPSGVPSGSPTKANIADAVAAVPASQVSWVGPLIKFLPTPPTATTFTIDGVLVDKLTRHGEVQLDYRLACTAPRASVEFRGQSGASWSAVTRDAAIEIYRAIAKAAPEIYPRWARWSSRAALDHFAEGIAEEFNTEWTVTERYRRAAHQYRLASEMDPENMLARLRQANCLERGAGELPHWATAGRLIDALEQYIFVRLREPTIFTAGYRASVVLSSLSSHPPRSPSDVARLKIILHRLDQERLERQSQTTAAPYPSLDLGYALGRAAARESARARRRLRPLWTVIHEQRFRHRFEPTGQERRQLRKAAGISRMCIRVRRRGRRLHHPMALLWRGWVIGRYLFGRSAGAGWQAHYNVACFYALLPQASVGVRAEYEAKRRAARLHRISLKHLGIAISQADDGELSGRWVRDEDPDLKAVRGLPGFNRVMRRLCPDELIVHFSPADSDSDWLVFGRGAALSPTAARKRFQPPVAGGSGGQEIVFRIGIFDESKQLELYARRSSGGPFHCWSGVIPIATDFEIWLREGDPHVHHSRPRPLPGAADPSPTRSPA